MPVHYPMLSLVECLFSKWEANRPIGHISGIMGWPCFDLHGPVTLLQNVVAIALWQTSPASDSISAVSAWYASCQSWRGNPFCRIYSRRVYGTEPSLSKKSYVRCHSASCFAMALTSVNNWKIHPFRRCARVLFTLYKASPSSFVSSGCSNDGDIAPCWTVAVRIVWGHCNITPMVHNLVYKALEFSSHNLVDNYYCIVQFTIGLYSTVGSQNRQFK